MADNKNQHFVPQFYLRNFSADPEPRSVSLFNIARARAIPRASIKSQCSRDYWHGDHDPMFEESVRDLEGLGAAAIKACILTSRIHKLRTLKTFVMFQLSRTPFSAEAFAETRRKMHELTYRRPPENIELDPKHNIGVYIKNEPLIRDMAACLVVNKTKIDFITSDNPVALTNWWFCHIYRQRPGAGVGLAQAGLEIYLPLSPKHHLILYDRNIWSVPKADAFGTLYLRKEADVLALNERQILNAQNNVYFASTDTAEHVTRLFEECAPRRKADKVRVIEWVKSTTNPQKYVRPGSPEAPTQVRERMISTEPNEIEPTRRVTLFSKRFKPRYDAHPSTVGALPDLAWFRIVESFRDEMKKNRNVRLTDIEQYAANHPLIHKVGAWKDEFWEMRKVG
jgi:hypothetical protein